MTPVTTITSFSKRVHPSLRDAELWAELYLDATGEVPKFIGHTVHRLPHGKIVATPEVVEPGDTIE